MPKTARTMCIVCEKDTGGLVTLPPEWKENTVKVVTTVEPCKVCAEKYFRGAKNVLLVEGLQNIGPTGKSLYRIEGGLAFVSRRRFMQRAPGFQLMEKQRIVIVEKGGLKKMGVKFKNKGH